MTDTVMLRRASIEDATAARMRADGASSPAATLAPLATIDAERWQGLSARAIEPNAYYLADWMLAVNATAPGRTGASALAVWDSASPHRLLGLMPVVPLRRAFNIPLPALTSAHPYGTLCTPLLDHKQPEAAAASLLQAARDAGARALVLRETSLEGEAMRVLTDVALREGLRPRVLQSHRRAVLDATHDAEALLRDALGSKKLKDLRRRRHRLAEHGAVSFAVARTPQEVAGAVEVFLKLEASGWKGRRGTALLQVAGDAAFVRRATVALAGNGECEIVTLSSGATPVAAGIVLRQNNRAFFFKLGVDESFAKFSPGVQLTLELTRHLCANPDTNSADSTASPDHPMINPIWRGRLAVGDVLIPLRRNDPVVEMIHGALMARQSLRDLARRGVHLLRGRR
ncbi:GNAT family N-acetyltransferase [Bradyrhizobium sp. Tv2a-2]|uniref:GNAT family N-acetyltransferase n=1 Tax=Bradyrhizobium sp. Tv2a-2 TaxID=113395 RepID=UPI0009FFC676|nr:GNAT family N-acetyltransferase [Bradyrhizobium sp. Tv2a-2]